MDFQLTPERIALMNQGPFDGFTFFVGAEKSTGVDMRFHWRIWDTIEWTEETGSLDPADFSRL